MDMNESKNFIEEIIEKDLKEKKVDSIATRFPPEPNGFLHIGHAKAILTSYNIAKKYGGTFNLRFDDTNPTKESDEYVQSIIEDVKWLGCDYGDRIYFASDYFERMYECAIFLIKKGKAYVCDLSAEEIKEYRGTLVTPGKESPYRNRSIDENLKLFEEMKNGKYKDGEKVLRAKIDMASPNMNLRDPVIYRIAHIYHHRQKDKWCIYPMYDFAHPLEDAFEGITHSLCTLEFEDHRPIYDWYVREIEFKKPPRQIEFAKLFLNNIVTGKRYIKKLVDNKIVDGWDDPRLVTISGLRRRGFTKESIDMFVRLSGLSKSNSISDYALLEYCLREDLKLKKRRVMAVIDPIKIIIDNYEENKIEELEVPYNIENEELGVRIMPFEREIYIDREDFMENPIPKYHRLFPGNEVRLMHAYFIKLSEDKNAIVKDKDGKIIEIHCTYDKDTKSGNPNNTRKVKGTIHWVSANYSKKIQVRLFENLIDEEKGVYNEETGELNLNPNSIKIFDNSYIEPNFGDILANDSYQFVRNGFFARDNILSNNNNKCVFNRIVSLKSSFKLPK